MIVIRQNKNRFYFAWVLFLAIMPVFFVKSFHYHTPSVGLHNIGHVHHDGQAQDTCDDCLICQFILSPFTEAVSFDFVFTQIPVCCEVLIYPDKIGCRPAYSHLLRAPPVV